MLTQSGKKFTDARAKEDKSTIPFRVKCVTQKNEVRADAKLAEEEAEYDRLASAHRCGNGDAQ